MLEVPGMEYQLGFVGPNAPGSQGKQTELICLELYDKQMALIAS